VPFRDHVGRTPRSAADASAFCLCSGPPDRRVRRGRGRPPHFYRSIFVTHCTSSLRALLTHLIDYAGLYPPAGLPLAATVQNYEIYRASCDEGWILNRLVLPQAKLNEVQLEANWRVTLLVDDEPGALPPQIETLEIKAGRRLSLPTYCEVPLVRIVDGFAKVRTGGLTPESIPAAEELAEFLCQAAQRRIAFKATAGLHHPVRSDRPLTYAPDAPRGVMHGFVNVFLAAAFAWSGADGATVLKILNETDAGAFQFRNNDALWRDQRLTTEQIAASRREFAHSFGSCSFEEPLADLRTLGWLT
jgi:hypothetical protein